MKTLLLNTLLISGIALGQSKRENQLYELFNKSAFKKYWGDGEFDKKGSKQVVKFYACLEKNYKINPYNYPEFTSIKNFEKKHPNTNEIEKNDILKNESLYNQAYLILNYQRRIALYESFPKCIKKSDIDW